MSMTDIRSRAGIRAVALVGCLFLPLGLAARNGR